MAKTGMTKLIERSLFNNFYIKRGMRCALEVEVPRDVGRDKSKPYYTWTGRVDFLAYDNGKFYAIEIKISKSDFKSKNGHNLVGDYNYYAIPDYLLDDVIDLIPAHVGIYIVKDRRDIPRTEYGLYKFERDYELINYKRAKRVESIIEVSKVNYWGDHDMKQKALDNMFTALNSTVRRLLNKE